MDIFNVLTLVGGLCLFLFGMNLMGQALERRAGGKLRSLLDKMTSRVFVGFLTGLGITAIIQSSSATTVMVVCFVCYIVAGFTANPWISLALGVVLTVVAVLCLHKSSFGAKK